MTPNDKLLQLIAEYARSSMTFDAKAAGLIEFVNNLSDDDLAVLLATCGFIPETYEHDSSEEKVYAKAMDIVAAEVLSRSGYEATVGAERSNAADVEAKADSHSLVLDAKAFRLSRTALNPKDYKIEALNVWRKGADYACLVGPLAGFPEGNSRLFTEAIRYKVALLTFSHLQFALEHGCEDTGAWESVWRASERIQKEVGERPDAPSYWSVVDQNFCDAFDVSIDEWVVARRAYFADMLSVADEQLAYFETEIAAIKTMSRDILVELTIDARKLRNKMAVIEVKKRKAESLLAAVEEIET